MCLHGTLTLHPLSVTPPPGAQVKLLPDILLRVGVIAEGSRVVSGPRVGEGVVCLDNSLKTRLKTSLKVLGAAPSVRPQLLLIKKH